MVKTHPYSNCDTLSLTVRCTHSKKVEWHLKAVFLWDFVLSDDTGKTYRIRDGLSFVASASDRWPTGVMIIKKKSFWHNIQARRLKVSDRGQPWALRDQHVVRWCFISVGKWDNSDAAVFCFFLSRADCLSSDGYSRHPQQSCLNLYNIAFNFQKLDFSFF